MKTLKNAREKKYYIIRTYSAGVWFGRIKHLDGTLCVLVEARRLWYWSGAASLSQMAVEGVKHPGECKFAIPVMDEEGVYLPQTIEVLPCTVKAIENIKSVPVWKV